MKATHTVNPEFLDNSEVFTDPFFKRFELRKGYGPLQLTDEISKDYNFPTFYGNVTCSQAIFLCDFDQAKALLPHPKMQPVNMLKGRSLVAIASYVYRDVINVASYNEIALTIPVMIDPMINTPVLPMIANGFKKFGYYVFSMPVTSKENQIRGRKIWGLPKVVHDIDIDVSEDTCKTTATDENGNTYLEIEVPTTGKKTAFDVSANLYSRLGTDLLQSATHFKADFEINKNMDLLWKDSKPGKAAIKLGNGKYGEQLKALNLTPIPLQTRFANRMNACFDLCNPNYKQPFGFSEEGLQHA